MSNIGGPLYIIKYIVVNQYSNVMNYKGARVTSL